MHDWSLLHAICPLHSTTTTVGRDYPLSPWRQDIANREVSYLMTHICPADHGTASWDDAAVQLLDDAMAKKFGVTPDFKCGHHRGHGVCKNKVRALPVAVRLPIAVGSLGLHAAVYV
jgi:hypothetical protein